MKFWTTLCSHGATIVGTLVFQGLIWVKPAICLLCFYRESIIWHGNQTSAIVAKWLNYLCANTVECMPNMVFRIRSIS